MKEEILVFNVVALVCTGTQFNLFQISQKMSNSSYNSKRMAGIIVKKKQPKATIMLFKTGKIIILGTQSIKNAQMSARKVCKQLEKVCGVKVKKFDFRIINILGSIKLELDFEINLARLCDIGKGTKLDSFPGAFYRMEKYIKMATVYASGKVTLFGAKSVEDLAKAVQFLEKQLSNFKKQKQNPILKKLQQQQNKIKKQQDDQTTQISTQKIW